jgi:hypothetical protein
VIGSEKELCDIFITHVTQLGFNVYPEYADWDIVIEKHGKIIGVQAKLKQNLKLLAQLVGDDSVHFKIALLPMIYNRRQTGNQTDWIMIAKRLKILPVMVDPIGSYYPKGFINFHQNVRNLFYYRWRPKKLLKVPEFKYTTPAGVRSPRKVSEYNIACVKLELFALQHQNSVTLNDARDLGLKRVPRIYYDYDFHDGRWHLHGYYRASKDYPHIALGIKQNGGI